MNDILKKEDLNVMKLRQLYERFGYVRYKMKKFEEYDLYAANKDFLGREHIITFTDTNGRLLALKPDVTLSIIKNYRDGVRGVQRVYYNENIYRTSRSTRTYKEIRQMGLECIGDLDTYNVCEMLMLAAKSLEILGGRYILELSHMGIIRGLLEALGLARENEERLLDFLREKNAHGIRAMADELGLGEEKTKVMLTLVSSYGSMDEVLAVLKPLALNATMEKAIDELEGICRLLTSMGQEEVSLDFSIVNDMSYYNGVLFRGYIDGIPSGVLAGGQYDELVEKMGKHAGAIGFAINFDLIEDYDAVAADYDVDVLLLYKEETSPAELMGEVEALTEQGYSVQAQRVMPEKLKYKELRRL